MAGKLIDLNRRAYLVAGAGGGGIGTAICTMLAEAGATVIAVDKTELGREIAAKALAAFGDHHLVLDAELTDVAAVDKMLAQASARGGPIRGGVNVVGGMLPHHWTALTDPLAPEAFDDVMRFNLRPTLIASTALARAIAAHGLGGSIVNIASAAGLVSMAYGAGYGAAKAALINLTRTMAVEWGRYRLRVNAVAPGTIRTQKIGRARFDSGETDEMLQRTRDVIPLGRRGAAEDVAGGVLYLLSDLSEYVSGQTIAIDGGALARAPYTDGDNLPVFVADPALRSRLIRSDETS
ncbi:MAG: short-chain dehydrogenase [Rhodospirillales bacterium]|nr:short-chain dehydrogenase [Rhodospirillales bacterium]